jgi:hypothetical protein
MVANHTRCFSWLLPICCALLLGSEAAMQAQVVTNVTGTIGSYESETRGSAVSNVSLDVQGSNFSLTSYISTDNLVRFSEDGQAHRFCGCYLGRDAVDVRGAEWVQLQLGHLDLQRSHL